MAANETIFKPGDTDNNLLRKILTVLLAQGTGSGPTGNVNVTGGSLTSAGAVTIADGADVAEGSRADVFETDPTQSASVISVLKGILSRDGDILGNTATIITTTSPIGDLTDAAVTNPASNASVIAALKGILTDVNKIPASPSTDRTTAAAPFSVELSDGSAFYTGTKTGQLPTALVGGRLDVTIGGDTVGIGQQRGSLTNRSGSMATGAVSQAVAAALSTRKYFYFQNISTETMWINFGTAAVQDQPSLEILPHASFVMEGFFVSTEAINVISATTGSKYVAKEA